MRRLTRNWSRRRRIRKKRRIGEFTELGFWICFDLSGKSPYHDALLDALIDLAELRGLSVGGGCDARQFSMFVSKWRGSATDEDRLALHRWACERGEVVRSRVGPLVDAWSDLASGDEEFTGVLDSNSA